MQERAAAAFKHQIRNTNAELSLFATIVLLMARRPIKQQIIYGRQKRVTTLTITGL
jgi:hypothetical protein